MKRKLLSLLVAGLAVSAAHADNIPTVYGKVNVTLNKYDFDDIKGGARVDGQDNWALESNASRIGVKGDFPLVDDLKAVYKLEYELFTDGSNSTSFTQRNTYAGLQGSWGTVIAGKNDTPLKAIAAETIQQFKDLALGDFKYVMIGENRENNVIQYSTPGFSGPLKGLIFSLAVMPGEDSGEAVTVAGEKVKNQNHGIVDRISAAVSYKIDTLYLALADDQNVQNSDTYRFVAQYGFGPVTIGGLYQKSERHDDDVPTSTTTITNTTTGATTTTYSDGNNNGKIASLSSLPTPNSSLSSGVGNPILDFASGNYEEQDAYAVSAAWKIDKNWVLKGQYVHSNSSPIATALGDTTAKNWLVGVDYKFTDASKVFAYYGSLEVDGDLSATTSDTLKDKTYAVGYELKF
jgi:predicted porin